jgi:hypothetical protein
MYLEASSVLVYIILTAAAKANLSLRKKSPVKMLNEQLKFLTKSSLKKRLAI